jgi:hypothetical protein
VPEAENSSYQLQNRDGMRQIGFHVYETEYWGDPTLRAETTISAWAARSLCNRPIFVDRRVNNPLTVGRVRPANATPFNELW